MATRSTIALEFADGTVEQVYCHWDGYLDNNGQILRDHYSDPFKLRDLIDLGDLSSLRPNIGTKHAFSNLDIPQDQAAAYEAEHGESCTFYGRDRGETGCEARKFKDFEDYKANHQTEEYEYILRRDGQWYVNRPFYGTDYVTLAEAFAAELESVDEE
jgi:hypothetical protein